MMTVGELKELLEDVEDDTIEVRLAVQPQYPFQHTVRNAMLVEDLDDDGEAENDPIFYIGEGGQVREAPYLPRFVANEIWQ